MGGEAQDGDSVDIEIHGVISPWFILSFLSGLYILYIFVMFVSIDS